MSSQTCQQKEKTVEKYLKQMVEKTGGRCLKFVSPGNRFVPDRICLLPEGHIFFIECKSPTGKLTSGQIRELDRLNKNGHLGIVISSKEEVDDLCSTLISRRSSGFPELKCHLLSRFGYGTWENSSISDSSE